MLIVMNLGGFFCKVSSCGYNFRKFRAFFIKVYGAWVNCCRAWVCKKCMDRELVVIKLSERWLDREGCRKIAGEVASINGIYEKHGGSKLSSEWLDYSLILIKFGGVL